MHAEEPAQGQHVVVTAWGETPLDALAHHVALQPMARPTPAAGEVLVRVRSCAVGWVDLLMTSGQYQHQVTPPYAPGLEYAGDVAAVGAGVTRVAPGDAVIADGLVAGPRSSGPHRDGGFATWAVLPEAAALPLPAGLSHDEGACLLGSYETAYHALIWRGRLQPGEVALVHGASGATGLAAVHVAKRLGATVIATGRSAEKLAGVRAQGADHVLALGEGTSLRDAVKALTGGRGADLVYDTVGGDLTVDSLRALRFGGRLCIVGWSGTPFVAHGGGRRGAPHANTLPTNLVQMKGLDVLGCPAVITLRHHPELREQRLAWLWAQVADGLRPVVGPAFALADYADAMQAKWHSRFLGGCVLRP